MRFDWREFRAMHVLEDKLFFTDASVSLFDSRITVEGSSSLAYISRTPVVMTIRRNISGAEAWAFLRLSGTRGA